MKLSTILPFVALAVAAPTQTEQNGSINPLLNHATKPLARDDPHIPSNGYGNDNHGFGNNGYGNGGGRGGHHRGNWKRDVEDKEDSINPLLNHATKPLARDDPHIPNNGYGNGKNGNNGHGNGGDRGGHGRGDWKRAEEGNRGGNGGKGNGNGQGHGHGNTGNGNW